MSGSVTVKMHAKARPRPRSVLMPPPRDSAPPCLARLQPSARCTACWSRRLAGALHLPQTVHVESASCIWVVLSRLLVRARRSHSARSSCAAQSTCLAGGRPLARLQRATSLAMTCRAPRCGAIGRVCDRCARIAASWQDCLTCAAAPCRAAAHCAACALMRLCCAAWSTARCAVAGSHWARAKGHSAALCHASGLMPGYRCCRCCASACARAGAYRCMRVAPSDTRGRPAAVCAHPKHMGRAELCPAAKPRSRRTRCMQIKSEARKQDTCDNCAQHRTRSQANYMANVIHKRPNAASQMQAGDKFFTCVK